MKLLLAASAALMVLVGIGPVPAQDSKAPRIEVKESRYDFGKVPSGTKVAHVFEVRNAGNGPLIIDHVDSSCRCAAAVASSSRLEPGAVAQIETTVDTTGDRGPVLKLIRVHSNDLSNPVFPLSLTMEVTKK